MTVTGAVSTLSFSVAAGGRIMLSATAHHADGTAVLLILTRLQ